MTYSVIVQKAWCVFQTDVKAVLIHFTNVSYLEDKTQKHSNGQYYDENATNLFTTYIFILFIATFENRQKKIMWSEKIK